MQQIIRRDLTYPPIDQITCDPVSARIIAPAYAGQKSELTAILQYLYHHFKFDNVDMERYASTMEGIAVAEMYHFDILGKLLQKLGADPVYSATPPIKCRFFSTQCVAYSVTPAKMLVDDISAETEAINMYQHMVSQLCNEQVAAVIERIILDEQFHLEKLNELLSCLSPSDACRTKTCDGDPCGCGTRCRCENSNDGFLCGDRDHRNP